MRVLIDAIKEEHDAEEGGEEKEGDWPEEGG